MCDDFVQPDAGPPDVMRLVAETIEPAAVKLRDICSAAGVQAMLHFEWTGSAGTLVSSTHCAVDGNRFSPAMAGALALALGGVPGMSNWKEPEGSRARPAALN